MKLKSFGCSFIWGSEMCDTELNPRYPSKTTWPALLANHFDLPYECYAVPATGNLQIIHSILAHTSEPALFVINWTYIDRFDYGDPWTNQQCRYKWSTVLPSQAEFPDVADFYYRNLHSEYRDKLTTLMNIKLCIDTLQQAKHQFIMTAVDNLMFDTQWHMSDSIAYLQAAVRPYIRTFDGADMIAYSQQHGHALGSNGHPLEAAHQDLFAYALDHFLVDKIKTP
jgi:hypothetical protein